MENMLIIILLCCRELVTVNKQRRQCKSENYTWARIVTASKWNASKAMQESRGILPSLSGQTTIVITLIKHDGFEEHLLKPRPWQLE